MTKAEVKSLCDKIAPMYGFDPLLVLAICEQESAYDNQAFRMENGFAHWLLKRRNNITIPELILLSTSYGLMQMLGQSLHELLGVFYASEESIGAYLNSPETQVDTGCRWLKRKLDIAGGDLGLAVQRYNGAGPRAVKYEQEVMERYHKLKAEFSATPTP